MSPGEYEISLKTSGKHIHGSPFNTKISGLVLFNANINYYYTNINNIS